MDWISVKDRLPELDERVLVCVKEDGCQRYFADIAYRYSMKNEVEAWAQQEVCPWPYHITHWMPIPELPTEGKKMNKPLYHEAICQQLNDLYRRKNADYGDSFGQSFAEYGMTMPCIRLEDKLNRLKALTRKRDAQVQDESVTDTLLDLANYAIMTVIEMQIAAEDTTAPKEDTP